ncbi:MAG: DUF512 domain-containing protein [Clostridiales bacterium]|jgi:putative radical SAM enzyme (TIGR03279 family)|nr:DUF512 domain-containing protein [Clostridiales bacterium]
MKNLIIGVEKNSIAEELDIQSGDFLLSIDEKEIIDILDYRYLMKSSYLELLIEKSGGGSIIYEIEKDEDEDLGLIFGDGIMDGAKSCKNKCIFCFVDQLPKNMRKTLYFKDDDSRLSFLQGNYITMTNMDEEALNRIIFYHLSPINISVHTTDLELRKYMLNSPRADNLIAYIKKLHDANIEMNFQVVLCKNINDNAQLDKTILELSKFIGKAKSLSIVPVGLTKFRAGLFPLEPFDKGGCLNVIAQVNKFSAIFLEEYNTRFVYASDEFYIKAGLPIPESQFYEDFYQIENGVGMVSSFQYEFNEYLNTLVSFPVTRNVTIVTGVLAHSFISSLASGLTKKFPGLSIGVICVENKFFGSEITVSGLLTGADIINCLLKSELGDIILIPQNALRDNEDVFLDGVTIDEAQAKLKKEICVCPINGASFVKLILAARA